MGKWAFVFYHFQKRKTQRRSTLGFNMHVQTTSKRRHLCATDDQSNRRVLSYRYGPGNKKHRAYESRIAKR